MTFDVLVDDRKTAIYNFMTFGAVVDLDPETKNFFAFGLFSDGSMIYSSGDTHPDTTHRISIFGETIEIGKKFLFSEAVEKYEYTIIAVTDLLEKTS